MTLKLNGVAATALQLAALRADLGVQTPAESLAAAQAAAIVAVDAHVAAADPHPQYLTTAEGDLRYADKASVTPAEGSIDSTLLGGDITEAGKALLTATNAGQQLTVLGALDQTAGDARYKQITAPDAGPPNDLGAGTVVDVTKLRNRKSVAANTTFTFSGTPTDASFWGLEVTNTSGAAVVITIPASYSQQAQAAITTFSLPAGAICSLLWTRSGTTNLVMGDPVGLALKCFQATFPAGANDTQTLLLETPEAGSVERIVVKSDSGTATYQLAIGGTNVGTAAAVSSTKAAQDLATPAAFAKGAAVTLARTANAACVNGTVAVFYRPVAA